MFTFATDYFLLVFVSTVGVIQAAASMGQLRGLLVFKSPIVARGLGMGLVIGAFVWFFSTGTRALNDYEGGLDAPTQALFFFLGGLAGMGLTLLVSSLVNARLDLRKPSPEEGLGTLKDTNYVRALIHSLSYWRTEWRTQTKRFFSG